MYFNNLIQKIKLPFRKDKELYLCLYHMLGFYPNHIAYYKQALMHKSVSVKGKDGRWQNNERLEFLGDAILDAVVGDVVYRHFENKREGFLTNARSKIVQRETLGKLAKEMGLDKLIRSNQQQNNSHNSYMAGNAFEALVGAIYLDYGYQRCMDFMKDRILNHLIDVDKVAYKEVNFKSKLLEWSQKNRIRLVFKDMPQTADKNGVAMFVTQILIEDLECGRGKGYSKKESQQNAAQETLVMLKKQKGFEESVFEAKSRRTAMEEQPEALLPEIPEELLLKNEKPEHPKKEKAEQPKKEKAEQSKKEKAEQPKKEKVEQPKKEKAEQPKKEKAEQPKKEKAEQPKKEKAEQPKKEKAEQPSRSVSDASDTSSSADPIEEVLDAIDAIPAIKKVAPVKPDNPAKQEAPAKKAAPAKQESPAKQEAPAKKAAPAKQENPTKQEAPAKKAAPAKQENPAKQEAPAKKTAPIKQDAIVESSAAEVPISDEVQTEGTEPAAKAKRRRGSRRKSTSLGAATPQA